MPQRLGVFRGSNISLIIHAFRIDFSPGRLGDSGEQTGMNLGPRYLGRLVEPQSVPKRGKSNPTAAALLQKIYTIVARCREGQIGLIVTGRKLRQAASRFSGLAGNRKAVLTVSTGFVVDGKIQQRTIIGKTRSGFVVGD